MICSDAKVPNKFHTSVIRNKLVQFYGTSALVQPGQKSGLRKKYDSQFCFNFNFMTGRLRNDRLIV